MSSQVDATTTPLEKSPSFMEEKGQERHLLLMRNIAVGNLAKIVLLVGARALFAFVTNQNNKVIFETLPLLNEALLFLYFCFVWTVSLGRRQDYPKGALYLLSLAGTALEVLIVLSVNFDAIFKATAIFVGCFMLYMFVKLNKNVFPDLIKASVFMILSFVTIFAIFYAVFRDEIANIPLCHIKVNLAFAALIYCFWFALLSTDDENTIGMTSLFGSFAVFEFALETARTILWDLGEQCGKQRPPVRGRSEMIIH